VKKEIQGARLTVTLRGIHVSSNHHISRKQNIGPPVIMKEIYRDEKVIGEGVEYMARSEMSYDFEFTAPGMDALSLPPTQDKQITDKINQFFGCSRCHLEWQIEVRLDVKGVDLTAQKQIRINELNV
jgi:hypothetical protein